MTDVKFEDLRSMPVNKVIISKINHDILIKDL